jgi:antitoxin (DNA-binding transcriptional repressor) of toxin-antitoxin stability system
MSTKQISISEFCAHTAEALQAIEEHPALVELVRDGKIVAYLSPAPQPKGSAGTLGDWEGTGAGFTLAPGCTLEDPAFSPGEWEELPDSGEL